MRVKVNLPPMLKPAGSKRFVRTLILRSYPAIGRAIKREARRRAKPVNDLGNYRDGWQYQIDRGALVLAVYNSERHAMFVEGAIGVAWGRHPNRRTPPYNALEPWVIRHFGTAGPTWAICKKIARDGIPARKALLADSIEPDVHAAIDKAVGEAIEKLRGT